MPQMNSSQPTTASDDEVDLAYILDVLSENRMLIVIVVTLFVLLGGLYAFLSRPIYKSNIMVQIEDNPDASAARSMLSDLSSVFDVKSSADAEIQILGSRYVVSRTVDALKLYITAKPRRAPVIGGWIARRNHGLSHPGILGLGGFAWGAESIDVDEFDVPKEFQGQTYKLTTLGGGEYQLDGAGLDRPVVGRVGAEQYFETSEGGIRLRISHIEGNAGVAFELKRTSRLDTIDGIQEKLQINELGKQSGVISAELESDDPVLLSATLNQLGRVYVQQNAERKAAQAEKSLEFLSSQEPEMKRQLTVAEERFNEYRNQHAIVDTGEEGKIVLQQSSDLEVRMLGLREKRQELETRFNSHHPALLAIDEQIQATQAQLGDLTNRIKGLPLAEQGLLQLQRDVRVDTDLFVALQNNIEQLKLMKAGKIGNVRVIDVADVPELPVKPKKSLVLLAAAFLGLAAGVALAFLRDRLFSGVTDVAALEQYSNLEIYATIPHSDAQRDIARTLSSQSKGQSLLAVCHPNDPAVEGLRSLRTALQFALVDARNNVVMIGGPAPSVGKSFLASNLATIFAAGGKRILLVDCDMRKGYLHQYFGLRRASGVSEVLAGTMSFSDAVHKDVQPSLDFLSTGILPPNPADLLLRGAWRDLVEMASREYDVVLLDAPPVLAVSDAGIMAAVAGTVFLVARFGDTRIGEITESVRRLSKSGVDVTGLLFNGVKPRGGNYAYGGKYGHYRYIAYNYGEK